MHKEWSGPGQQASILDIWDIEEKIYKKYYSKQSA